MKVKSNNIFLLINTCLWFLASTAQNTLDYKTYGNSIDPAIIFLHGGPGYNSVSFEETTASELANRGFYVICYDRRGEGRNESLEAAYTYDESVADIEHICAKEKISQVNLIGHSFGGLIAVKLAISKPDLINAVILVGVPISFQETLSNIITESKAIYEDENDTNNLYYINLLEKMDSSSLEYSTYSFMHAMNNGFYSPSNPNEKAISLYEQFNSNPRLKQYASKMGTKSPRGFWQNENYTSEDLSSEIKMQLENGVQFFGIYGKEDGLFSESMIKNLTQLLGKSQIAYLENASHSVFIDRQDAFIKILEQWLKP